MVGERKKVLKEAALQDVRFLSGARGLSQETAVDEREAIRLVQRGDKKAYHVIVTRYMEKAYFIALGFVRDHQDALDISQEAFIKAFRNLKKYDSKRPFFPWFYKLMKNLCLDHLRKKRRQKEVSLEGFQIMAEDNEDRDLKRAILKAVEELPSDQKEVILLRYFQQFSYQEIAELTGKPMGTIMSSLHYAKKHLREILEGYLFSADSKPDWRE